MLLTAASSGKMWLTEAGECMAGMPRFDCSQHELARHGKLVSENIDVNGRVVQQLGGFYADCLKKVCFKKVQLRVGTPMKWLTALPWLVAPQAAP